MEGRDKVISQLIKAGADKTVKDKNGHTALDCAKLHKHAKCVKLLDGSSKSIFGL